MSVFETLGEESVAGHLLLTENDTFPMNDGILRELAIFPFI